MDLPERLIRETIQRYVATSLRSVKIEELPPGPQGYSGSHVRYFTVDFRDDRGQEHTVRLVIKNTSLLERRVLAHLNSQGQGAVPFSYTLDVVTDRLALVCQEYIPSDPSPVGDMIVRRAAESLARIHQANRGHADDLAWLPRANRAFFDGNYVLANWRMEWTRTMLDTEFAREWGVYTERLYGAAAHFLHMMGQIWDDGHSLTLVHGDLHAGNILVAQNRPFLVDWEHARYGSLYLDLPNYFAPEHLAVYRDALAGLGHSIPEDEFRACYHETSRYVGFKYLGFWLQHWRRGGDYRASSRAPLAALIATALDGRVPG